jgi:solute carrier family 25 (mitochondrial folate transporter), member 32
LIRIGFYPVSFYDYFKRTWSRRFPEQNLSLVHLGSAITAGAISDLLCNPMFVVRTRLQTESLHRNVNNPEVSGLTQRTIVQTIQLLFAEGGFFIFWRGMSANLLGLSHVAIQFPLYEKLKKILIVNKNERQATTVQLLLASGISKMSASLLTYPHEVIRSRMMDIRSIQGIGFFETCRRIYVSEGIVGFYAGLSVSLLRVIPNTMLTFLVYERTLSLIDSR